VTLTFDLSFFKSIMINKIVSTKLIDVFAILIDVNIVKRCDVLIIAHRSFATR